MSTMEKEAKNIEIIVDSCFIAILAEENRHTIWYLTVSLNHILLPHTKVDLYMTHSSDSSPNHIELM